MIRREQQTNRASFATPVHLPHDQGSDESPIRAMALHALLYCERLFYLEEVEEIRLADANVYAGRRLHDEVLALDDETPERRCVELASNDWGIVGKVDAVRRRDGQWVVYEHKRGRCRRGENNEVQAWPSDRIQAIAYAVLLAEELGESVHQARIRYHADNVTAFITIDDQARGNLCETIERARELRRCTQRPPVTDNEALCPKCSLAPVCLPEEERLAKLDTTRLTPPPKLFPANRQRQTIHVTSPNARIGRSGDSLVVTSDSGKQRLPMEQIDSVLIHGFGQMSTQAIHACAQRSIAVQWFSAGGRFVAGTTNSPSRVQQRIRQYQALADNDLRLRLSKSLVQAKVETQLRYLLRATRGNAEQRKHIEKHVARIREALRKTERAQSSATLLGLEGISAKAYFACLPGLLRSNTPKVLRPQGRTKHPPRDCFNAALSFGYSLIHSLVQRSILAVGLEPAFGFYHQPRTSAPPLVLDVMELFRTLLWEIPLIGSINRGQWNGDRDFAQTSDFVWLSADGRRKAIQLFEQRLQERYKHPFTGRSLNYARIVELEVRLLEKEWSGCTNVFAKLRMR